MKNKRKTTVFASAAAIALALAAACASSGRWSAWIQTLTPSTSNSIEFEKRP